MRHVSRIGNPGITVILIAHFGTEKSLQEIGQDYEALRVMVEREQSANGALPRLLPTGCPGNQRRPERRPGHERSRVDNGVMCGRFTRYSPIDVFARMVGVDSDFSLTPRYNILPGQALLLCRNAAAGRELATLKWGLIPPWEPAPKTKLSTINAKAETVATSRLYRYPFRKQRCLIAADGFYEPGATVEKRKLQYYFHRKDGRPFFIAGLWGRWKDAEQVIDSCTLLTTEANTAVKQVHARMPVIIPPEAYDTWLDPELEDPHVLQPLLTSSPGDEWEGYPVGYYTRDDRPELIEQQ